MTVANSLACTAVTKSLDDTILGFMTDEPKNISKGQKRRSLLKKYWTFCLESQQVDIFPLTFINMCRYAFWLPRNNIGSWESATKYINAIRQLGIAMHLPDPLDDADTWELLRKKFHEHIPVIKKAEEKMPIHLQQFEALSLDAIEHISSRRIELMAQDALHMFTAVRVGHTAPKVASRPEHLLRWEHVRFMPLGITSLDDCTEIFLHIQSTKTLKKITNDSWWTAFGKLTDPSLQHLCPVRWFILHYKENYLKSALAKPSDPIFKTKAGKPLNMTAYTKELRQRLQRAVKEQLDQPNFNVAAFSGISWRKASLSQLVGYVADSRAANFAGHKSIETTRAHYAKDTVSQRAAMSNVIGSYRKHA